MSHDHIRQQELLDGIPSTISELSQYDARSQQHEDKDECGCHGSGWVLSDWDAWYQCAFHFKGQRHPEDHE